MVTALEGLPRPSVVYVSGPMTGRPLWNWPAFEEAARRIRLLGHEVISPTELDEEAGTVRVERGPADEGCWPEVIDVVLTDAFDFRTTIARDLDAVDRSDAIYLLPGWEASLGARIEMDRAKANGLHVIFHDDPWAGFRNDGKPWPGEPVAEALLAAEEAGEFDHTDSGSDAIGGPAEFDEPTDGIFGYFGDESTVEIGGQIMTQSQYAAARHPLLESPGDIENAMAQADAGWGLADSTNPKDRIGVTKPQLDKVPPALLLHAAAAMKDGAAKYGPYNWREKQVRASVYYGAALRHLLSWFDGEQVAEDSGCHHLGHAAACLGIVLDAEETGNLIDDRPVAGAAARIITSMTEKRAA